MKLLNKKMAREWAEIVIEAAVIIFVMYFICWPHRLDGSSMSPGLNSGDRVVISRLAVILNKIKKDDIITCKILINGQNTNIIKRLVGAPGDLVEIYGGAVYINGILSDEAYVYGQSTLGNISVLLGPDEYFVLGDNRAMSMDSRDFGIVHKKNILGKVFLKFYPFWEIKKY